MRTLRRWTENGTLIAPRQLATAWGRDLDTLETAVQRGDLFEVWVNGAPYFASAVVGLGQEQTTMVCRAIAGLSATEKLMFLMRAHGGLGGQTVVQALASGTSFRRIEELAAAAVCA